MQKQTDEDVAIEVRTEIFEYLKFKLRDRDDAGKMLATHYLEQQLWQWFQALHRRNKEEASYQVTSRLIAHAQHEFSLLPAPENQADADLQQWLQKGVLDLLFVLSQQGHSGGTMHEMMKLLNALAAFENLSPITDNPEEWDDMSVPAGSPLWQNKRNTSLFSRDGGKTYSSVNAADENAIHHSLPFNGNHDAVQAKKD